jgi:mRNA interferase RelE/StbE
MPPNITKRPEPRSKEPRPPKSKQLHGKHSTYRRIDVGGEYRIIYEVRDDELVVVVVIVAQREGVYELLKRLG